MACNNSCRNAQNPYVCHCECNFANHCGNYLLIESVPYIRTQKQIIERSWKKFGNKKASNYIKYNFALLIADGVYKKSLTEYEIGLINKLSNKLSKVIVDTISESLRDRKDSTQINKKLKEQHFVCEIIVIIVKLYDKLKSTFNNLFKEFIDDIFYVCKFSKYEQIILSEILKKILYKIINEIFSKYDVSIDGIRIFGIIKCPNIDKHYDILEYCVKPIFGDILSGIIKDSLINNLFETKPSANKAKISIKEIK
jgi:hypothetical protein